MTWNRPPYYKAFPFNVFKSVALPSLSLADRMNTDLKGEGEPCLNDSMLFTSSLILVNDSGSDVKLVLHRGPH